MFNENRYVSRSLGRHRLVSLRRLQARHASSFACFEFPVHLNRILEAVRVAVGARIFLLPWFVETVVDLTEQAEAHWSANVRRNLRRVARDGFSYSVSTEAEHFRVFVNDYWRPLIGRRFGEGAADMGYQHLVDPSSPAHRFEDLHLLRVFKDDQWVSAMLVRIRQAGIPEFLEIGVLNGDATMVEAGAQAAGYWALFEEAKKRGFDRVSLMWCFPDLAGGTFRYKLQYRPLILMSKYRLGVGIVPGTPSDAAESFLLNHPFIHLKDGRLTTAFFGDSQGEVARSKDLLRTGRLRGVATSRIEPAQSVFSRR
jgi:hypothetical protein